MKGNKTAVGTRINYFGFCPIFSFNFSPPPGVVAGVDGVPGVAGAGEEDTLGMCNFGLGCEVDMEVADGVPEPTLDCLNVMRGPGGGIPWSSRLRFVEAAAASFVRVVLTRSDL